MDALLDAQIHTGNAVLTDSAVLIEGGSILGMVPRSEVPAGATALPSCAPPARTLRPAVWRLTRGVGSTTLRGPSPRGRRRP